MKNEEIKEIVSGLLPDTIIYYDVNDVNHKPHPFMIGSKHIQKYHLDLKQPCAMKGCNLSYEQHTSDKVIFLQLKDNLTKDIMQKVAEKIINTLPEKSFDGFSFIETKEKYRII